MPAIQCSNGKWKWGEKGPCVFASKKDAEKWGYPYEERKKKGKEAYVNMIQHLYYVNAVKQRPEGKFLFANIKRLEKRLLILLKGQKEYVMRNLSRFFDSSGVKENKIMTNASKKDIKKMVDDMPYQKEIAEVINLYAENSLKKAATTMIAQKNLGRFGVSWQTINKKAADFLGEKLSHELSDYKGTIHATTVDRINEILYDSYEKGRTYQETSKLIQEQAEAGVFSQARGELISVREIGVAYEKGNYLPMQEVQEQNPDRKVMKYWSTVNDSRVTETHKENEDLGWVDVNFIYNATGGDESAPGSDNPRCRCTTLYEIR